MLYCIYYRSVIDLLAQIPDAQGTIAYLNDIRRVVDSYSDKKLYVFSWIEKAWHALFFTLLMAVIVTQMGINRTTNFVTLNVYVCIEMNAHSLITVMELLSSSHYYSFIIYNVVN